MNVEIVNKGSVNFVRKHFTENEVFSKSLTTLTKHYLPTNLLNIIEAIRIYYDTPIIITSSYRNFLSNVYAGGNKGSYHKFIEDENGNKLDIIGGSAFDFKFIKNGINDIETLSLFQNEITNKGTFYLYLRELGLTGIGLYDDRMHIDTRINIVGSGHSDSIGNYNIWDNRTHKQNNFIDSNNDQENFNLKRIYDITAFIFLPTILFISIYIILKYKNGKV